MKRVGTGIEGLDQILDGGLIANRAVLVQGEAGTGKTTMALQYLVHGALHDEPGVMLSMEYEISDIVADMHTYGWNAEQLIAEDKLRIISPPGGFESPDNMDIDDVINLIFNHVQAIGAKRLVIDSLNSLEISLNTGNFDRRELLRFITLLRDLDCTTLLLSEKFKSHQDLMYTYLAHGVIELYYLKRGASRLRGIEVLKMRGVNHSNLTHSMSISAETGITVLPHEVDLGL